MKKNIPLTTIKQPFHYLRNVGWKTSITKHCFLLAFSFVFSLAGFSQFTATWAFTANASGAKNGTQQADITIADVIVGNAFASPGYSNSGVKCQPSTNWITAPTNGWQLDFPISPNGSVDLTITGLTFAARTSGSSGNNILSLAYEVDGNGTFTTFGSPQVASSGGTSNIDFGTLATTLAAGHTYVIRLYIYAVLSSTSASRSVSVKTAAFTGTSAPATVPTKLISFDAQQKNGYSILNWHTTNEVNMVKYVVEKSTDAIHYFPLKAINANNGNSNTYQFADDKTSKGISYYRLQMMERNGKYNYSGILVVNMASDTKLCVFPNPFKNELTIRRKTTTSINETIHLTDISGKKIMDIQLNSLQQRVDLSNFSKGIYILNFCNGEEVKVIKE